MFRLRFLFCWKSAEKINLGTLRIDSAHTFSILCPHHVFSLCSLRCYIMKVMTVSCPQGVYGLIEELGKKKQLMKRRRKEVEAQINYKGSNYTVFLQVAVDSIILIILCLGCYLICCNKESIQNYEIIELNYLNFISSFLF